MFKGILNDLLDLANSGERYVESHGGYGELSGTVWLFMMFWLILYPTYGFGYFSSLTFFVLSLICFVLAVKSIRRKEQNRYLMAVWLAICIMFVIDSGILYIRVAIVCAKYFFMY